MKDVYIKNMDLQCFDKQYPHISLLTTECDIPQNMHVYISGWIIIAPSRGTLIQMWVNALLLKNQLWLVAYLCRAAYRAIGLWPWCYSAKTARWRSNWYYIHPPSPRWGSTFLLGLCTARILDLESHHVDRTEGISCKYISFFVKHHCVVGSQIVWILFVRRREHVLVCVRETTLYMTSWWSYMCEQCLLVPPLAVDDHIRCDSSLYKKKQCIMLLLLSDSISRA